MTRTIKTNPAYAALAYEKTIVHDVIIYLKRNYIGIDGDPKNTLICEDVMQVDSVVPPEEVARYVEGLIDHEAHIELELGKFEFTRRDDEEEEQPAQRPKSKKGGKKGGTQIQKG